ncbi:DM13 domain-containing protein [Hoeflea sp.]|uniref:DM13 domain-containing protein n=1 Tax=Hoeflea sp. TaxID=1940281 RepID=UPI0037496956
MLRWIIRLTTHGFMLVIGFALGIYLLPIITAPPSPDQTMLAESARTALYKADLQRDLKGSDFLHWGEGTISISTTRITHQGSLAPGPDYKLYLVPEFVEDEAEFLAVRDTAQRIGDIKTFDGFVVDVPSTVDIEAYTTVLVWCETFGEFISAAKYR